MIAAASEASSTPASPLNSLADAPLFVSLSLTLFPSFTPITPLWILRLFEQRLLTIVCGRRPPRLCRSSPALTDTSTEHAAVAVAQHDQRRWHVVSPGASQCAQGAHRPQSSRNPPIVQTGARCCRRRRWETRREHSRSGWPQRSAATSAPNPLGRGKTPARRQSAASAQSACVSRAVCMLRHRL